jgi:hypothetical protein
LRFEIYSTDESKKLNSGLSFLDSQEEEGSPATNCVMDVRDLTDGY